eukprot:gene17980-23612_t
MVGLSGSSAIVVATFRSLLKFYGLTISDLNINKIDFPQVILDIEKEELNISAGLQDRVIQTYGGLVHMDFTNDTPVYTSLDPSLLPIMYLAYNTNAGGESGKVHSTVKERWNKKDIELINGMNTLDQNFSIRRHLYGDNVVGYKNILAVNLATRYGLSAKFTGSGGALLCIPKETKSLHTSIPLLISKLPSASINAICFPDEGAAKRFSSQFKKQGYDIIICGKVRDGHKRIVKIQDGNPFGKNIIIVDDLVQTGGTLHECGLALLHAGATQVNAFAAHAVFPNSSWKKFSKLHLGNRAIFNKIYLTNSIPNTTNELINDDSFEVLDLMPQILYDLYNY